jgi:hypothetical protein
MSNFGEILEIYFGLDERMAVEYGLISRYRDKVSDRLKARRAELAAQAKVRAKQLFSELLSQQNTLLASMAPEPWEGGTLMVPFCST